MKPRSLHRNGLWILTFTIFLPKIIPAYATNITDKAFGGIKDALPAAYGDFNSDELTDIFILTSEQKVVQILFGNPDSDALVSHHRPHHK